MPPERSEIEEIAEVLSVPASKREGFILGAMELAEIFDYARNAMNDPRAERREAIRQLEAVLNSLEKARRSAESRAPYFNFSLSSEFSKTIGTIVSQPGVQRFLSEPQPVSPYDQRADFAPEVFGQTEPNDGKADENCDVQAAFADFTGTALASLLEMQCRLVAAEIRRQKRYSGGRPRNRLRVFMLRDLQKLHDFAFSQRATSAPGGTFNRMCELLFDSYGEPTEGLETAIKRFLK